jgi:hypothetical protein
MNQDKRTPWLPQASEDRIIYDRNASNVELADAVILVLPVLWVSARQIMELMYVHGTDTCSLVIPRGKFTKYG